MSQQSPAVNRIYTWASDFNEMFHVVNYNNGGWPEHQSNWCGVANVQAINDYAYWEYGGNNAAPTQEDVASVLNSSSAQSPWGYSAHAGGFKADIAADGGSDPRAIAWGMYTVTPFGYYDHNYIYPGSAGADQATRYFARDFGGHGLTNPISVTVNGGEHSVVVSGIQANEDPSVYYQTAAIFDVLVWDPWYGNTQFGSPKYYNTSNVYKWWPFDQWKTYAKWWGQTYNTGNGYDPDPDPTLSQWYNVPPLATHWGGNYVTIEQDNVTPSTYSENIALDENGNQVPYVCPVKSCSIPSHRTQPGVSSARSVT